MVTIKELLLKNINRIAETHFAILPMLESRLKQQIITQEGKKFLGNFDNYFQVWKSSLNDKFFDMGTFIRLGSTIEGNLKAYYMHKKSYANNIELMKDANYEENIFQRLLPWQNKNALKLYKNEIGVDLTFIAELPKIQELIINRHLYAHTSGLLNEKYTSNIRRLNGREILTEDSLKQTTYPLEDYYWFEPLEKLHEFIEASRHFFQNFPD